jgi:hypothetical protein
VLLLQVCLPAIWALSLLLVTYRLGVLPAESAASLKLLDKGVAKEALAALVLVQFPVELVSAVIAGRCETGKRLVDGLTSLVIPSTILKIRSLLVADGAPVSKVLETC